MTTAASLFTRDDTFFGVCEALGEDFGISATWFRIAFAVSLLWNPLVSVGGYVAFGLVVALSRWLSPSRKAAVAETPVAAANNDNRDVTYAQAA